LKYSEYSSDRIKACIRGGREGGKKEKSKLTRIYKTFRAMMNIPTEGGAGRAGGLDGVACVLGATFCLFCCNTVCTAYDAL